MSWFKEEDYNWIIDNIDCGYKEFEKREVFYSRRGQWIYDLFAGDKVNYDRPEIYDIDAYVSEKRWNEHIKNLRKMYFCAKIIQFYNFHIEPKIGKEAPQFFYRILWKKVDKYILPYSYGIYDIDWTANEICHLCELHPDFNKNKYIILMSY